jgi:predicted outer membrane lipoprotein
MLNLFDASNPSVTFFELSHEERLRHFNYYFPLNQEKARECYNDFHEVSKRYFIWSLGLGLGTGFTGFIAYACLYNTTFHTLTETALHTVQLEFLLGTIGAVACVFGLLNLLGHFKEKSLLNELNDYRIPINELNDYRIPINELNDYRIPKSNLDDNPSLFPVRYGDL